MICRYCGKEMREDDVDFYFKGNENIYWVCDHCHASYFQQIRFHKHWKGRWSKGGSDE